MKVLVTGASGLLGTHVVLALQQQNIKVRALVRQPNRYLLPPDANTEIVSGDLTDTRGVAHIVSGCTHVIHAAALTSTSETDYDDYHRVNVAATVNLAMAAARAGVKRLVYVSTANTLGFGTGLTPGTEEDAMKEPFTRMWYAQSKLASEQWLKDHTWLLDIVIVHPAFMLDNYDAGISSGRIITRAMGRKIIFYPPGGKNFVAASDVATGIVKVLTLGKRNEHYLLAHENISYREFYRRLCTITHQQAWLLQIPAWVLYVIGPLGDVLRWAGVRTALTSANLRALCLCNYYSNAKAKNELGMEFTPLNKVIADAVQWFETRKSKELK